MLQMIEWLFQHQAWADAALLRAIEAHEAAGSDQALRTTLYHTVTVQRFFLCWFQQRPFDVHNQPPAPETLAGIRCLFQQSHADQLPYIAGLRDADLARRVPMPWIADTTISLAEMLLQVVMHSQNHRGQCLSRLRAIGGNAPILDFILWAKDHRAAEW